jgi:MFS family permease
MTEFAIKADKGHKMKTVPKLEFSDLLSEFRSGGKILFASFIGISVSISSLLYYSSGIFIKPLQDEFGWTRAQLGGASFLSVITLAIFAPLVGRLVDRCGLRLVATLSLALYAACVFALSRMNGDLSLYYAIVVAFTILGLGSSPVAFTRAVSAWFVRNRGLALGISMAGTGLAGMVMPLLLSPFVAEYGWRAGYQSLVITILAAIPIVWLWIRDHPAEHEITEPKVAMDRGYSVNLPGLSFAAARKGRIFWILGLIFFLIALAVSGLIISFIPLLLDAGVSPVAAGAFGATLGASVIAGRVVTGFLIDRLFAPRVAAVLFSCVAIGCLALAFGGLKLATVAAIALGLAMGAETDLIGYLVCRYFGLPAYGQIYGAQYSFFAIGGGISSIIAGSIYDNFGNYDLALISSALLLFIASILCFFLPAFPERFPLDSRQAAS